MSGTGGVKLGKDGRLHGQIKIGAGDPRRDCLLIQTGVYSLFANSEY